MAKTERWSEEVRQFGSEPQRKFVLSYRPVITQIACQVASGLPPAVDLNDLISDGTVGLIKAIGTFDPGRQVQFSSYAESRIRGAILDGLRSLDWMPRSLRRALRRVERARLDVQQRQGRLATSEELAREMDLTLDRLHELMAAVAPSAPVGCQNAHRPDWSHLPISPDEVLDANGPDPQSDLLLKEDRRLLREALSGLPPKERMVMTLYYFADLKLREIGERVGLSESRICQIHGRAMGRLRRTMARRLARVAASRPRPAPRRLQEAS